MEGDRFGRLALTPHGLRDRDRFVLETVRRQGAPVVIVLSGGYAPTPERTAALQVAPFAEAQGLLTDEDVFDLVS